ncbi:MAG: NTP transferase domain-containing protein [Lachnospiraceae bacterium]
MKTGAIILTAGEMKNGIDPLYVINNQTIISYILEKLKRMNISPVIVVLGDKKDILREYLLDMNAEVVCNDNYSKGLFSSIKIGIEAVKDRCDQVFLIKGNVPSFTGDTLRKMIECDSGIVRPVHEGRLGHPVLVRREYYEKILRHDDVEGGFEKILEEPEFDYEAVNVDDDGILLVNSDLDAFELIKFNINKERNRNTDYNIDVNITVSDENLLFSREYAQLFFFIDKTHSLRSASECLHISYSKAWTMIKNLEKHTGIKFVNKSVGGYKGGHTVLTEEGKRIIDEYKRYSEAVQKVAEQMAGDYFSEFKNLLAKYRN